jgi:hypothetical protein
MNHVIKKLHVALVLAVVLVLPLLPVVPGACSEEWSAPDRMLSFLSDAVGLDLAKYNVTLQINRSGDPSDWGGLPEEHGKYSLISDESTLDVTYKFVNRTLFSCHLYVYKGSPFYVQPSVSVLNMTEGFLDRYQTFTGESRLQPMQDMLDTVTEVKEITKSVGNIKLTVLGGENSASFEFMYTANGLNFTRKRTYMLFEDGYLKSFIDGWSIYKVGSDSVNVSEEEAISIARKATEDMPDLYSNVGNETVVLHPVLSEQVDVELMVGIKEPLTLCPMWHVELYFDKFYGNYYGVAVDIWADTGAVSYPIYGKGIMGDPSSIPEFSTWTVALFAFCIVAVATIIYKQKLHKKQTKQK